MLSKKPLYGKQESMGLNKTVHILPLPHIKRPVSFDSLTFPLNERKECEVFTTAGYPESRCDLDFR